MQAVTCKFQVETVRHKIGYSRPIPFAVRPAARAHCPDDWRLDLSSQYFSHPEFLVRSTQEMPRNRFHAMPEYEHTPPLQGVMRRFDSASKVYDNLRLRFSIFACKTP
jgi:hypothetical protein